MGWFKVDDQLAFHSKTVMAGNTAMGLWVRAGAWASAQLTDGKVPKHMAKAMANPEDAEALVMAGLWVDEGDDYRFHDWDVFQPSAAKEKARREDISRKRSEAGKKGAQAKWEKERADGKDGKPDGNNVTPLRQRDGKDMAPSRPVPSFTKEPSLSATPDGFNEFWAAYPKKVAKKAALRIYERSIRESSPEEIINGAKRYAEQVKAEKLARNFIKSPDGWLNAGRWEDEIVNAPQSAKKNPLWDS